MAVNPAPTVARILTAIFVVAAQSALGQPQGSSAVTVEPLVVKTKSCRAEVLVAGVSAGIVPADARRSLRLPLKPGAQVVAVRLKDIRADASLLLRWPSLAGLGDETGPWLAGKDVTQAALTDTSPGEGFAPAKISGGRLAVGRGTRLLRQVVFVPKGPSARWFPKMTRAFAVAGTSQLIKPYLPPIGVPLAADFELRLLLPAGLHGVCCDGGVGAAPQKFTTRATDEGELATLTYDSPPGSAFGLFICWQDARQSTIAYQRVLTFGGTHDWRRLKAQVTAPTAAAYARPIVLKWAGDKVVGEVWVDNITLAAAKAPQHDLLKVGDFEGEEWSGQAGLVTGGPDGSRCLYCKLKESDGTRGWWVPRKSAVPVEGGRTYVLAADVKARGLHQPGARPHAAVLVEAAKTQAPGVREVKMVAWSRESGARCLVLREPLEVLAPLRDRRPRTVRLMPCYYGDPFTSAEVIKAFAENAYRSGITWTYGRADCELARLLLPRGHKVVQAFGRQPFVVGAEALKYLEAHPECQAVKFNGKRDRATACPTWFLSPEGEPARQELRERVVKDVKGRPIAGLDWDIEQPVIAPPSFCFCQRCLKAFADFAGLGADAKLDPQDLLKEPLRSKWVDFRCRQNARLVEMVSGWVKKLRPDVEFSVYSGYHSLRTREHYGIDWALLAPHLDAGMTGYGFHADQEQATWEALGGKPYLAGEMYYLSPTSDARPAPQPRTWANRLLRQIAFTGGHGLVIWYLPVYDGAAFYQTSLAAEIIAEHEVFFTRGERVEDQFTVSGLKDNDWFALRVGRQVLLLVLNFSGDTLKAEIQSDQWQAPGEILVPPWGRLVRRLRP